MSVNIYNSLSYTLELELRGVFESTNSPPGLTHLLPKLRAERRDLLDKNTVKAFKGFAASNDRTIQTFLVPYLLDLPAIARNPDTLVMIECEFLPGCVLPLLQQTKANKISPPWPDFAVSLRTGPHWDCIGTVHDLGLIATPFACTTDIAFPCFTLEFRDNSDIYDAEVPNRYNTAMILHHLRLVSAKAHGETETRKSFDNVIRCLSATMSRSTVAISAHWTTQESNGLHFYSSVIKSFTIKRITYAEWDYISRWLRNAIDFSVKQTLAQLKTDLAIIENARMSALGVQRQVSVPPRDGKRGLRRR